MNLNKSTKIYIAGHRGMVGSACWRVLQKLGYSNLIGRTSKELDLRNQLQVYDFLRDSRPVVIIDAAAKVGGIVANKDYPYQFLMENMQIQNNLISAAHDLNATKFIFLGSSCIYPKLAPQPLKEEYLLTDSLEPTNEWYAIAKISGVKLCEAIRRQFGKDFVSLMPTNLYGSNDNFDLQTSHVLPAMIRKFHEAKVNNHSDVTLWGSGSPMREFLHVDDLANAVVFALENVLPNYLYNVGTNTDISIKELAYMIQSQVGHKGNINWDSSKPDGTPKKLMDSSKMMQLGWRPTYNLKTGIANTYSWFLKNQSHLKEVKFEIK
ncbi:GDP-L-fucose synthase [Flavobacteriales bacterium]|nr:GDP-L-fucose synthase [Flavobacteriales bacterium]